MKSNFCRGMRRASVRAPKASSITVAVALWFPLGASAAEYLVSSDAELRAALASANIDGDATATIRLAASFTITSAASSTFASPTKPIIFDTQGFVLTRNGSTAGFTGAGGPRTFYGTYVGVTGAAPGVGLTLANGTIVSNGSVTGGTQTTSGGAAGAGITLAGSITLTNNGAVKGGGATAGTAGTGITVASGGSVVNAASGTIVGGDGNGGTAGNGVAFSNALVAGSLANAGTIRGGDDTSGGSGGGNGVRFANSGTFTVGNTGLVEGGRGAAAIFVPSASNVALGIVNAGTIRAGEGAVNAIQFSGTASGRATLELQAGSHIVGNVVASQIGVNDAFRLGGAANGVFDVSAIGDTAQYRYFDTFVKTGASTWALTGTGTVTAPWTVEQGTLQIGNGGTSGSLAGNVAVNADATLAFNRSDRYTYAGIVSGAGGLAQNGTGTTVLTGASTYTGPTAVNLGTLAIDGSIASAVTVAAAGTLAGAGTITGNVANAGMVSGTGTIAGTLTNAGTVAPGNGSGVLTVAGNYVGNGGTVRVNTVLGNDSSATGRLVVKGDTSGSSTVRVTNVGGAGAPTVEGIKIIDVQGASNGTFALAGDYTFQGQQAVVAGPYAYRLVKHGVSTSTDGGWYLRSSIVDTPAASSETAAAAAAAAPLLAPTVPVYEAYASVLQRFNEPGTLQQRVGNRSWSPNAAVPAEQEAGKPLIGRGVWARAEGSNVHVDPSTSTTSASYNTRMWKFEAGVDAPVYLGDAAGAAGTLVVGPTFHYGVANANVSSMFGQGAIDATGYGFGANATWYGTNGSYMDARATVSWYDTDLRSSTLGTRLANNNRGNGVAASLEAGHRLPLGGSWSVTPQAQLAWSQVRFDAFTDQYGATVSRDNGNSLVSRLGVSLDHETTWTGGNGKTQRSHVYGITNLYYDFLNGTSAHVANLSVVSKEQALWAGLGIGASMNWDDDRYTVYGELVARTSLQDFGDSNAVSARLGVRYRW